MTSHSYKHNMNSTEQVAADKLRVLRGAAEPHKRPAVDKLGWSCWMDGTWIKGFRDESLTMDTQDLNPGFAIRKVAQLFETRRYDECASLIQRLSYVTMKTILTELPMEVIIEGIPNSLVIIDAIYYKFYNADVQNFPSRILLPEKVVSHLIKWVTSFEDPLALKQVNTLEYYLPVCKNILRVVTYVSPTIKSNLKQRQLSLEQSVQGLGNHGLVDTSEMKLMNLHDALKVEFQKMAQQLKIVIQKLEESSFVNRTPISSSVTKGPAPTSASHQRLLQLNQLEVQERLIKNKTLLNVVEPAMTNSYLAGLLKVLEKRIESDKEVLFNFAELRKDIDERRLAKSAVITPIFQQYSQSFLRIMEIIDQVSGAMATNGYHSDEDEGISKDSFSTASSSAQSGVDGNHGSQTQINNISKSKGGLGIPSASTPDIRYATNNNSTTIPVSRTNGTVLQNSSVSLLPGDSVGSLAEVDLLRNEVHTLKKELVRCRETITKMQEREKVLRDRLSEQAQKQLERGSKFEDLSLGENRPSQLVRRYGNLYSQTRLDAFDALDELPEMAEFDDLKGKLLFSVIVLAFRSAQQNQRQLRHKIRQMLCLPETKNPTDTDPMTTMGKELDDMITIYLRKTVEKFDISASSEEVCNQVWATLYDYPSLKNCAALKSYIEECVRIAWSLVSQNPPLIVDYDCRQFDVDYHTRFHTSDPDAKQIRSVLWPALLEGENGPCVQKGVVIT